MAQVPAVDDRSLREAQMERFTEGIGNLGDYAKSMQKSQKISIIVSLISGTIMLLLVVGIVGYEMVKGGGIDGFIDKGVVSRRFNCTSENSTDLVRNYDDATKFIRLYGGECRVWHV